jgi:dolichyl-phosphate-mannose--protein O-mannosyl transferase
MFRWILLAVICAVLSVTSVVSDDSEYVTCGSAIKLTHSEGSNEYFLSSDGHRINSGSGQQLVTASPDKSKQTALWIIKEKNGAEPCVTGTKIPYGSKIRLTHLRTGANLHSHNVRSPLSSQLEVSGYGEDGQGDGGDDWIVNPVRGSGTHWKTDEEVVIQHVDTSHYLGCTEQAQFTRQNCGHNCPVMNHLEIFGRKAADSFTKWKASLGVFLN